MVIDIPLSSWQPDNPNMNNPGLTVARNVLPAIGAQQGTVTYGPAKRAALFASSSLNGRPLGAYSAVDRNETIRVYAGTATDLYEFNTLDREWEFRTRTSTGYNTSDNEYWNFIQFDEFVIGTNYNDYPQYTLAGQQTPFENLTELTRGRHLVQHMGFVILGNTYDAIDGNVPNRVRWSAKDNPTIWDYDPSYQSDFQNVQDVGPINGMVVDGDVWLLCKDAIVRMYYAGSPWIYEFENVVNGKGCAFPKSVITVDGTSYFLDDDGFYSFRRGELKPIGIGKVNETFFKMFNSTYASRMTTTVDPRKSLINWTFASMNAINGKPDVTFVYNYLTGDWSEVQATVPYLYPAKTLSWTIQELDVYQTYSGVPASWDSPIWAGGNSILWGIDDAGKIYTLTGTNLQATLETREMQLTQGSQKILVDTAIVLGVRPVFEGTGVVNVTIGNKQLPNAPILWARPQPINQHTGFSYQRERGRYHKVRVNITDNWDKASFLQVDFVQSGGR